ncbi:MAG: hypothetical protein ACREDH_06520 [Methylocella sp.]
MTPPGLLEKPPDAAKRPMDVKARARERSPVLINQHNGCRGRAGDARAGTGRPKPRKGSFCPASSKPCRVTGKVLAAGEPRKPSYKDV